MKSIPRLRHTILSFLGVLAFFLAAAPSTRAFADVVNISNDFSSSSSGFGLIALLLIILFCILVAAVTVVLLIVFFKKKSKDKKENPEDRLQ